jgi:low affinity Fe/Cu permease
MYFFLVFINQYDKCLFVIYLSFMSYMLAQQDDEKTFSSFFKSTYDNPRKTYIKSHGQAEKLLTRIIIFAVIVLGIVIGISVFHFSHILLVWKVGISTFILLLPFCLFLQASLNVEAVKDERHSKIENGFRKAYAKYNNALSGNGNKQTITNQDISDEERFRVLIRERSLFLMQDSQLYTIYRHAYQLYLSYKKGRIYIVGKPDLDELKYGLLQFELDELLNIIVVRKMKEDGIDFRSYLIEDGIKIQSRRSCFDSDITWVTGSTLQLTSLRPC